LTGSEPSQQNRKTNKEKRETMVTGRFGQGGTDDVQPWQTKLKDQYGIGVTLDTSRGNKRFKVRFRWRSKILNLGR
jgi:hypothetical protein